MTHSASNFRRWLGFVIVLVTCRSSLVTELGAQPSSGPTSGAVTANVSTAILVSPPTFFTANGIYGIGNAFTQFTGPTTSIKTFTLPNVSTTILTTNAAVTTGQGGLGADNSASTGIPLFTAGSVSVLATTGTGNVARIGSPTFTGTITTPDLAFNGTTTVGVQLKSLTTTQKNAVSPVASAGALLYDSTLGRVQMFDGAAWHSHVRLDGDTMTGNLSVPGITGITATGITSASSTDLALTGNGGTSLVLGNGGSGTSTLTVPGGSFFLSRATGDLFQVLNSVGTVGASVGFTFKTNNIAAGDIYQAGTTAMVFLEGSGEPERMRLTYANGNLLIGGTTDISGSGGAKIYGSTAASSTTTGALQVVGGISTQNTLYTAASIHSVSSTGGITMGTATDGTTGQLVVSVGNMYLDYPGTLNLRPGGSNGSTLTAGGALTIPGQMLSTLSAGLAIVPTTGTTNGYLTLTNTGGTSYFGIERSTGGSLATGTTAYGMVAAAAGVFQIATNGGTVAATFSTAQNMTLVGTATINSGNASGSSLLKVNVSSDRSLNVRNLSTYTSIWAGNNAANAYTEFAIDGSSLRLNGDSNGNVLVLGNTAATNTTSGAFQVVGGGSFQGDAWAQSFNTSKTGSNSLTISSSAGNPLATFANTSADAGQTANAYIVFKTGGTARWDLGQSISAGNGNFEIYNESAANVALSFAKATSNATFAGSITTAAPAGGTAAAWKFGTVAVVSPTSPNRTIELDVGGTIYYIAAKTTNN